MYSDGLFDLENKSQVHAPQVGRPGTTALLPWSLAAVLSTHQIHPRRTVTRAFIMAELVVLCCRTRALLRCSASTRPVLADVMGGAQVVDQV